MPKWLKGFSLTAENINRSSIPARLKAFLYVFLTVNHLSLVLLTLALLFGNTHSANATVIEFNNAGGTSSTNGLHFYIEDTTHIQVKRLNNTAVKIDNAFIIVKF